MATDIDLHLGRRLRRRRRLLGLTQQQLAVQVGIRFQQIQNTNAAPTASRPPVCGNWPRRWRRRSAISTTA